MKNSILASKLGTAFIAKTLADYAEHLASINKLIADLGEMPEIARDSILRCFKGNAYCSYSALKRDNVAQFELNDKTWILISNELKAINATNAAAALVEFTYKKDFNKVTLTEQRIHEVLSELDTSDELQTTIKDVKAQIETMNGESVDFSEKVKIKKGTTEQRIAMASQLAKIACLAWNDNFKDRVHLQQYSEADIAETVAKSVEAIKTGDKFALRATFELKSFANGNIDIKFSDTLAGKIEKLAA